MTEYVYARHFDLATCHRLSIFSGVQLVAKSQLRVLPEQGAALLATMERVNAARTWIAAEAMALPAWKRSKAYELHHAFYYAVRARFELSAQMTARAIASVAACFERDLWIQPVFHPHAAVDYDARILTFVDVSREVTIATLDGRQRIGRVGGDHHEALLAGKRGASTLCLRKGRWYLHTAVDVVPEPLREPAGFLGVDMGIVNLATDSDGERYSGAAVERVRVRQLVLRTALQTCGSRSARRHLQRLSGKEQRFRTDTNHVLSKRLVTKAKDTGRGIALEDLKGIRDRVTVRKGQRARHGAWAFFQLRSHVEYKATRAGVPVTAVDPRNTSRTCPECGHCAKRNRPSQAEFRCVACGFAEHADHVAARNIASRAAVNRPIVSNHDRVKPPSGDQRMPRVVQGQAPRFSAE